MTQPVFVDQFTHTTECSEIDTVNQLLNPLILASGGAIRERLLAASFELDEAFNLAHSQCKREAQAVPSEAR